MFPIVPREEVAEDQLRRLGGRAMGGVDERDAALLRQRAIRGHEVRMQRAVRLVLDPRHQPHQHQQLKEHSHH